jgi:hypothetical protein
MHFHCTSISWSARPAGGLIARSYSLRSQHSESPSPPSFAQLARSAGRRASGSTSVHLSCIAAQRSSCRRCPHNNILVNAFTVRSGVATYNANDQNAL